MNSGTINILSIVGVASLVGVNRAAMYNKCEADHECTRGEYCYLQSGLCSPCTNCSVYYRKKIAHLNCPKTPQQCGDCLLGYYEDILTEGMKRESCIRSMTSTTEATSLESSTSILIYVLIAVLILGFIAILLCLGSKYWKKLHGQLSRQNSPENGAVSNSACNIAPLMSDRDVHPTVRFTQRMHRNHVTDVPPPPYRPTSDTSLLIDDTGMPIDTNHQTKEIRLNLKQSEDKTTKAVPFIEAYTSGESDNEQGNYPAALGYAGDENENIGPNPPDLQDENTMESPWCPPLDYGQLSHNEASVATSETADAALCTENEDSVSSKTPNLSPQHSPNLNRAVANDDSGISDTSCRTSSTSLPHRPFLERPASVPVEQGLPISQSEEDIGSNPPKRPRRDSGTQSWSDETEGIFVCINAQVAVIKK